MPASQDPRDKAAPEGAPRRRKPYQPPTLKSYGSVAKLTQGSASAGNDLGGMSKNTMCL